MLIKVKVHSAAKEEKLIKRKDDKFEVWLKEKAVKGRANQRLREFLAEYFSLPLNKVILLRGFHRPNKVFEIKFCRH